MKCIIPIVSILAILLSLFALPVGAAPIPEDEIIRFLGGMPEQIVVPEYVPADSEWYESYRVNVGDLIFNAVDFSQIQSFFSVYGDALPEGLNYLLYINGVAYSPIAFSDDGTPAFGNPELMYGCGYRDVMNSSGSSSVKWNFDFDYDNTLTFYFDFMTFQVDETLANGFTLEFSMFYEPCVESIDYNSYAIGSSVSESGSSVLVSFPAYWSATHVRDFDDKAGEGVIYYGAGFSHDFTTIGVDNHIQTYPFGFFFPVEKYYYSGKALYAGNIPDGSKMTFTYTLRMKCEDSWLYEPENPEFLFRVAHVAEPGVTTYIENGTYKVLRMEQTGGEYVMTVECSYTKGELLHDAEYLAFCCGFDLGVNVDERKNLEFTLDDAQLEIYVDSLVAMLMGTQKTNKLLDEVVSQLAEQGKTLNDILTGGAAGDDLIAGGDQIQDAGSSIAPDLDHITDFEDTHIGVFENNLDDLIAGADVAFLSPALAFVQTYTDKIVDGVPDGFLIVFTLPMVLGIFMYMVSHPVRAPRPDTSGDLVTRETFTTTTVLAGKHKGATTTVRTVSSSHVIGRESSE